MTPGRAVESQPLATTATAPPPKAAPPLISVVTVTYDSEEFVGGALDSVLEAAAFAGLSVELIAVDNASRDGSVERVREKWPAATVIGNPRNVGFGVANNQAFSAAAGEYILLLNPDARLSPSALGILHEFLAANPSAAAASPAVRGPRIGGVEEAGMLPELRAALGHFLFLNRFTRRSDGGPWTGLAIRHVDGPTPRRVGWAGAAALLLRTTAVRQVGGFNPAIFLYGEDIDLCARLGEAGWQVWLVPTATAEHEIAGSQRGISSRWVDGLHDFYAARASRAKVVLFDLVMVLGLGVRGAAAVAGGEKRHRRRMFAAARRALALARRTIRRGR
jgi:N-acetylglucosaminyl-diphospho-decaprenol L-rhamnosyltransferase